MSRREPPRDCSSPAALVRQLVTLEVTIKCLLELDKPVPTLKEKLSQAETTISLFPEVKEELATFWRTKLAKWWKAYAMMGLEEGKRQEETLIYGASSRMAPEVTKTRPASPDTVYAVESTKLHTEVISLIEKSFSTLPDLSSTDDITTLKRLINTLVLSFDLIPPELPNASLQATFFGLVLDKFSAPIRHLYTTTYTVASPYTIFHFLRLEIEAYIENHRALSRTPYRPSGGDCSYCHGTGHFANECTELYCLTCCTIGHNRSTCKRGPLFAYVRSSK